MSKSPNASAPAGAGNPKKVTQVFAGLAALTFAAGGGLVFCLNGKIQQGQAAAANKEAEVGSSEQVAKRLDATKAAYDETTSRVAFLETAVTEKSYVPTLLQQLQTLAAATHLTVMSVQPAILGAAAPAAPAKAPDGSSGAAKKTAPPPYDTMGVNLSVTGTYADTMTFLYDLTQFPKVISVEGAQFSPGGGPAGRPGQGAAPQVTTQLKLTAFVFHDDATTAAPAPGAGGAVKTAGAFTPPTGAVTPPTAAPTLAGAAGRAAQGAVAATKAADGRSRGAVSTL